jgi:hypothetical protein
LEILFSIESRLMFNIRFESADEDVGVLERLIEAALLAENPFSFYPEIILDSDNPCEENSPPTRCSTSFAPDSEYFGLLSAPVGEPGESYPDRRAREGRGIRFSALCRRSHRFRGSFRQVAMGVLLIPLSPGIRGLTDDGGTVADPCD